MRNNIKKIFNCFLMIAILSVSICNTITYAKAESYTYSIGTNYGGIDTSEDATYTDNNVKTGYIYGNRKLKLSHYKSSRNTYDLGDTYDIYDLNHKLIFNKEKFDETVFENEIEKIIEDREGININDYKMITNEMGNTKVIDYIELVGGVETNRGFTAIIENGIVEKIYMNNSKVCLYDNMVEKPKLNEKKVMSDIYRKVSERYKVIKQDSKWIYDVNENKFKYIIFTDYIADKLGGLGRNEVCIEVD